MFALKNGSKTITFMSGHFDKTMTILSSHFLRFGALKISTGDYFMLRLNKLTYSKEKKMMIYLF